jgi:hypothetical protein
MVGTPTTSSNPSASTLCTRDGPFVPNSAWCQVLGTSDWLPPWNVSLGPRDRGMYSVPLSEHAQYYNDIVLEASGTPKRTKEERDYLNKEKLQGKKGVYQPFVVALLLDTSPRQIRESLVPSSSKRTLQPTRPILSKADDNSQLTDGLARPLHLEARSKCLLKKRPGIPRTRYLEIYTCHRLCTG